MFEAADELRFLEGQVIYSFDERHRHNFVPRPAFANANPYFALEKSLKPFRCSEAASYTLRVQKSGVRFRTPL